jgi:hypothetical protein
VAVSVADRYPDVPLMLDIVAQAEGEPSAEQLLKVSCLPCVQAGTPVAGIFFGAPLEIPGASRNPGACVCLSVCGAGSSVACVLARTERVAAL